MSMLSVVDHAVQQIDECGAMIGISREWYESAKAKLAEYENLEEQGLLIRLPVPFEQIMYWLGGYNGTEITKVRVFGFDMQKDFIRLHFAPTYRDRGSGYTARSDEIGKAIFLTRAEAEAALAGREVQR